MTLSEARERAEAARAEHDVGPEWALDDLERRFIQLGGTARDEPATVRDLLAWVARFSRGIAWVDLALDDRTGAVVRVERSR